MTPGQRIIADLRAEIESGALPAGTRLPSSRVLAERYSVARNTARAATQALEAEGLVAARHGSGVFVAGPGHVDPLVHQLREERVAAGYTQEDLASRAGVSQGSVSRTEAGTTQPSLHLVRQLADALGLVLQLRPHPLTTRKDNRP